MLGFGAGDKCLHEGEISFLFVSFAELVRQFGGYIMFQLLGQ